MNEPVRWSHPRDAAAEAVVFAMVEDFAKERKEHAREFVTQHLRTESSRGVDAVANGQVIGSVTRSKDTEKVAVTDDWEFIRYVIDHHPECLTVDYRMKDALLRGLKEVDGVFIDKAGVVVPGVGKRVSHGSVRVNKDPTAKDLVRELLSGTVSHALNGFKEIAQ